MRTGFSGNRLGDAIVKSGEGVREEGEYCQILGSALAPVVIAVLASGYVMERLVPTPRVPGLLGAMEIALSVRCWDLLDPTLRHLHPDDWHSALKARFGLHAADNISEDALLLTHGDPTVSNVMQRNGRLIFIDPIPFKPYIPKFAGVDRGKLLQSALGWETVAFGDSVIEYSEPPFWSHPDDRRRALFWCAVHALRICDRCLEPTERNERIQAWCTRVVEVCLDLARI